MRYSIFIETFSTVARERAPTSVPMWSFAQASASYPSRRLGLLPEVRGESASSQIPIRRRHRPIIGLATVIHGEDLNACARH